MGRDREVRAQQRVISEEGYLTWDQIEAMMRQVYARKERGLR